MAIQVISGVPLMSHQEASALSEAELRAYGAREIDGSLLLQIGPGAFFQRALSDFHAADTYTLAEEPTIPRTMRALGISYTAPPSKYLSEDAMAGVGYGGSDLLPGASDGRITGTSSGADSALPAPLAAVQAPLAAVQASLARPDLKWVWIAMAALAVLVLTQRTRS